LTRPCDACGIVIKLDARGEMAGVFFKLSRELQSLNESKTAVSSAEIVSNKASANWFNTGDLTVKLSGPRVAA